MRTIEPAEIPSGLVEPAPTSEPPPTPEYGESTPEVYFLGENKLLVPAPRTLRDQPPQQLLDAVLQELTGGPKSKELSAGLSTALPPELSLKVVQLVNGQAIIELLGEQVPVSADQSTLAVGQIVLSATSVPTVSTVILTREGVHIEAPLGDGVLTLLPVTAADYQNLVAPED